MDASPVPPVAPPTADHVLDVFQTTAMAVLGVAFDVWVRGDAESTPASRDHADHRLDGPCYEW
jgi:hypothetical protein